MYIVHAAMLGSMYIVYAAILRSITTCVYVVMDVLCTHPYM